MDSLIYVCRSSLWKFLFDLLEKDNTSHIVTWTNRESYEFRVINTEELAKTWGRLKGRNNMTYAKFSRALRYYYGKGVVEKVPKKRFTYQFVVSDKTSHVLYQEKDRVLTRRRSAVITEATINTVSNNSCDFTSSFLDYQNANYNESLFLSSELILSRSLGQDGPFNAPYQTQYAESASPGLIEDNYTRAFKPEFENNFGPNFPEDIMHCASSYSNTEDYGTEEINANCQFPLNSTDNFATLPATMANQYNDVYCSPTSNQCRFTSSINIFPETSETCRNNTLDLIYSPRIENLYDNWTNCQTEGNFNNPQLLKSSLNGYIQNVHNLTYQNNY